jgi:hypothetical protein
LGVRLRGKQRDFAFAELIASLATKVRRMARDETSERPLEEDSRLKIYLLPNLMTAGNLFCGFLALTRIVEADLNVPGFEAVIREALFFILLACIFDLLDGRGGTHGRV